MRHIDILISSARGGQTAALLALIVAGCAPETGATGTITPTSSAAGSSGAPVKTAAAGAVAPAPGKTAPVQTAPQTTPPVSMLPTATTTGAKPATTPPPAMTGSAGAPATIPPATMAGAAGGPAAGGGMMMGASDLPKVEGAGPTLPEIMGDCPDFKNGTTVMVAGHKSIQLQVGDAGKGGPILYYWHGTGSSAAEARMFPGNSEIVSMGGIVAAFNGNQSSGSGRDCSGTGAHNMADFNAADQIAACGVKNHGIDAHRIYSTGCSAGGLQTGCMAMVRSSYIAAAAPNSGGIVGAQPWQDMHSPAIFTMHGGSGDMVIVTFSQTSASLDMNAKMHGSFVVNCDHGGGHCAAPGDLQKSAWQFMKDHPWGVSPSPWAAGIPSGVPSYCKIF